MSTLPATILNNTRPGGDPGQISPLSHMKKSRTFNKGITPYVYSIILKIFIGLSWALNLLFLKSVGIFYKIDNQRNTL